MRIYSFILLLILAFQVNGSCQEDQYRIGIDDILSINFWQEEIVDLSTVVRVTEDGMITLPIIGNIKAEGYTTSELAKKIVEEISILNIPCSQATVIVTEYNSQTVVLTGAVNNPDKYHFERIPNLLEVIRQAGGAAPTADLSDVTIVRQVDGKVEVINVDLLKHLRDGDLSDLPVLKAKDLINVPESPYGLTSEILRGKIFKGKNIYYIYGAVNAPGIKTLSEDIELVDAIADAGGVTAGADLENVRVVLKDVRYSTVLNFNLKKYSETGRPARYRLHPEDTIIIPYRPEQTFWSRIPEIIVPALVTAVITTIATAIIVDATN